MFDQQEKDFGSRRGVDTLDHSDDKARTMMHLRKNIMTENEMIFWRSKTPDSSNVNLLTEGYGDPGVERNTKSGIAWKCTSGNVQMILRGELSIPRCFV